MKTKIVYCLVSDSKDYYYEQLLISLCSLKKHNPDAVVEIFCDQETFTTLTDNRRSIFEYNIHVNPIEVPENWTKMEKSRYLKTNLRKLTHGDYLYIDTDTIICSSLDFVDDYSFEIGAVNDSHVTRTIPKFTRCKYNDERWIWSAAKKTGANIEGCWHFNSGVMFAKDTLKVHELYARWYDLYQKQLEYGVKFDQLPLLLTNREMNNIISPLDWSMNCQVPYDGIRDKVAEAKIIHYFPSKKSTLLSSHWILDSIKENGRIPAFINRIIDDPAFFFIKKSRVIEGDAVLLLDTPSLLDAYTYCRKMFNALVILLDVYVRTKRIIYKAIKFIR